MFTVYVDTPIGKLKIVSDGKAVCSLLPAEAGAGEDRDSRVPCELLDRCVSELRQYFAGTLRSFSVPVKPEGTLFRQRVWKALQEIPFGETVSYGELAERLGCGSARAIGGAVGKNPVLILIPCHRVLAAHGKIGGFSAGIERKRVLLSLENVPYSG